MPNPRAVGLEGGAPGLGGKQVGTTSDDRPIVAWPASAFVPTILDRIEGEPVDDPDWNDPSGGDESAYSSGGGGPAPGYSGESWTSSGAGSLVNDDTTMAQQNDEVCAWVQSDNGGTVGIWFGVQDADNLYYLYLTPKAGNLPLDGFEDGDISEYSGDADASVQSTTVYDGTYALQCDAVSGDAAGISSTSGLDRYPQQGDVFATRFNFDNGSGGAHPMFQWAVQSEGEGAHSYYVDIRADANEFRLVRRDSGGGTVLASAAITVSNYTNQWSKFTVDWAGDGSMTVTLEDASGGNSVTISATDTTFTSGGIGFSQNDSASGGTTGYFDMAEVENASESELRLGKYVNGAGSDIATGTFTPNDPTGWYLLRLAWWSDGLVEASAHPDHDSEALVTIGGQDTDFTSGGVGVEFTEAGENFDMFSRCGTLKLETVDSFEDADLAEYTKDINDSGSATVQSTTVQEGSYALEIVGSGGSGTRNRVVSHPGDGLPVYPSIGDIITGWIRATTSDQNPGFQFAVQSGSSGKYTVELRHGDDVIRVLRDGTVLADINAAIDPDTWYRYKLEWRENGEITVSVKAANGNHIGKGTVTDTTFEKGGIAFHNEKYTESSTASAYFDIVERRQ